MPRAMKLLTVSRNLLYREWFYPGLYVRIYIIYSIWGLMQGFRAVMGFCLRTYADFRTDSGIGNPLQASGKTVTGIRNVNFWPAEGG